MECERIRERFSSLSEKDLTSPEEKEIKEHLSYCPDCRREFEKFQKTMQWLHSVEEVEVPDDFLPELHKKMEKTRDKATAGSISTGRWFNLPISVKLPIQAVAMVAIVFLVLYLSKIMPTGVYPLKESKRTSSVPASIERSDKMLSHKMDDEDQSLSKMRAEAQRPKDLGQAEAPAPAKESMDASPASPPQMKVEAKKEEIPSPKSEIVSYNASDLKEQENAKRLSVRPEGAGKGGVGLEKSIVALKPSQEIILRISDREKVVSRIQELVNQFGGELITTEKDLFVASLPTGSFSEFEKEVAGLGSIPKKDKLFSEKQAVGSMRAAPAVKKKEGPGGGIATVGRTTVRILIIQE
ncbi:MAG TPA: zf-HC2 domain-containing protein [Thermodesulfobacteriota bacterium]|nr:zf-HC2 domain-containing protein [Thermodesulfobacteriota bacterium]